MPGYILLIQEVMSPVSAVVAIIVLIVLIARFKVHPFLALIVVSLILGLAVGMPLDQIVKSFETGSGNSLGHIAIVIGLGTMLGKMMAESGGAERIAITLIRWFGEKNVPWAMLCVAMIVGLPVFFEVGLVLLIPIAFNVAKRTGKSLVLIGLPMAAGLSVVHGLVPPHPAALLAVQTYEADIGKTILYALIVGIPAAIVAGPLFTLLIHRSIKLPAHNPLEDQFINETKAGRELPGFGVTVLTILLPVILMLAGSWADRVAYSNAAKGYSRLAIASLDFLRFIGISDVALLIAVIVSFWSFGFARGFNREQIQKFCGDCLAPLAGIILIVGAGAGFGRVLMDSGVSKEVVSLAQAANVSPLVLAWLVAVLIRLATGSATIAMITACNIVAPLAPTGGASVSPELLVLATGSGSLIFSHVNDGGFWLIKEYFGMTVPQTIKTWSILETIISVVGLALTLLLSTVI